MSATPTNGPLESMTAAVPPVADSSAWSAQTRLGTPPASSRHEALQALLAFSALHEQIRHRRAHSSRYAEVADDTWHVEQFVLDEVLRLVAERALTITGADGVAIALAEGDAVICRASSGSVAPDPGARVDPDYGFSGACLASGRVVRCDDSETDQRVDAVVCRSLAVRSMVAVPLLAKETVIGLVEAFSSEPFGFNDSDVRGLTLLAELILSALKPEEEDRLAEVSQRVVHPKVVPAAPSEISAPLEALDALEENTAAENSETGRRPVVAPNYDNLENSRPGLGVVFALTVFALILAVGLYWGIRRHISSPVARSQPVAPRLPSSAQQDAGNPAPVNPLEPANLPEEENTAEPASPETAGTMPQVTGIRHWSSPDSSTVVIDLQDQVQYEAHRLTKPERIYFDLHDTRLASGLTSKTIEVGDTLLQKIRVAQPVQGVTRIVLETKGASNFSVSLEPNPYRLVVEVRSIGAKPQDRTKLDLFGPTKESPAMQETVAASQPVIDSPQVRQQARQTAPRAPERTAIPIPGSGSKLRIVLDAGHGGWDLGTVGRRGLLEKDLVLDIVGRLGKLVENRLGAEVIYTRRDDDYVALEKRAEIANLSQASLFLSIHANYSDYPSARGVETYYTNTYSSVRARPRDEVEPGPQNVDWTNVDIREKVRDSRRLAASIQRALYGTLSTENPGLSNRGVKAAQYVVLTGTSMPAVLAEVSFVSSPTDENNLHSSGYRQQIAEALYRGIAHYAQESAVKMASASRKPATR